MNRIRGLDFARVLMTLGIVFYHFSCYSSAGLSIFNVHANGVWGGTFNAAFFVLSGFCLQNKYGQGSYDIVGFYYKRWKTVVFPYALIFLFAYLNNVATTGRFFYLDVPQWYLALSFIGLDGYVQWFRPTYFITGVWFIGAILLVYLVYPLINIVFKKLSFILLIALFIVYEIVRIKHTSSVPIDINPLLCILSFSVGMFLQQKKEYLFNKILFLITAVMSAVLILVPIGGSHTTKELLLGWSLFLVFSNVGHYITSERANSVLTALSQVTYIVILIHLPILHKVLVGWDYSQHIRAYFVLFALVAVLFILAFAINVVLKGIYASKTFKWLDGKLLKASHKTI